MIVYGEWQKKSWYDLQVFDQTQCSVYNRHIEINRYIKGGYYYDFSKSIIEDFAYTNCSFT